MKDFTIPPQQPSPSNTAGQAPAGLPPKHKHKQEIPPTNSTVEDKTEDLSSEEALQKMLAEEFPPIVDKPPQCDWHLGAVFAGNYPDPFSLPALQYAQHSLMHSTAALLHAIDQAAKEDAAAEKDAKDK